MSLLLLFSGTPAAPAPPTTITIGAGEIFARRRVAPKPNPIRERVRSVFEYLAQEQAKSRVVKAQRLRIEDEELLMLLLDD